MSAFGLRINSIEAASIEEYNKGLRDRMDITDALLPTSLFLDYLESSCGLNVWKGESTRDIIIVRFGYGTRSFSQEEKHLKRLLEKADEDKKEKIQKLIETAEKNKEEYVKKTKQELRLKYYKEGVSVTYNTHDKQGKIIKSETIHYNRLVRSAGKAKKGEAIFACDRIFKKAKDFLTMGITLPSESYPLVEMEAYSSLITSSIVGRIKINPKNILVLDDYDSYFKTNVVSIELDDDGHCIASHKENYKLSNALYDGQSIISKKLFPSWASGFCLLRQHMFKSCAFCGDIELFFRDYCSEHNLDYSTYQVPDKWGNKHYVKDLELITTTNSTKFLKFGASYEYFCKKVNECKNLFGVVKVAHPSKYGRYQRQSYQMVNTQDLEAMDDVMLATKEYIKSLQTDDDEFLRYLEKNKNFSNDFEVLLALVKQDPSFLRSEYFRDRRRRIINSYVLNVKSGKLIQEGDNLTIVGNIYGMLLHAAGEDSESDPTFEHEDGTIQCYTKRFDDGEYLAGFRSPMNSMNNVDYMHNHYHPYFDKYFTLDNNVIVVNLVNTDFQDRSNGSDQDSDMLFVTNQKSIVERARYSYKYYPTIVNNIPKDSNHYSNTPEDLANMDSKLAAMQLYIGLSSNIAQLALSYSYSLDDEKYTDYVCILATLAQVAIDSAKRQYNMDIGEEIDIIKKNMEIDKNLYPAFWQIIKPEFKPYKYNRSGKKISKINHSLQCPMNTLYYFKPDKYMPDTTTLPMSTFFRQYELSEDRRKCKKVEELIQNYSLKLFKYNTDDNESEEYLLLREDFENLINDIRQIHISNNYLGLMSWLINRAFIITSGAKRKQNYTQSLLNKNRALLLKTLYDVSPNQLLQCFSGNLGNNNVHIAKTNV